MRIPNPKWRNYHPNDPDAEDAPEFIEVDERDQEEPFYDEDGPRNYIPAYEP